MLLVHKIVGCISFVQLYNIQLCCVPACPIDSGDTNGSFSKVLWISCRVFQLHSSHVFVSMLKKDHSAYSLKNKVIKDTVIFISRVMFKEKKEYNYLDFWHSLSVKRGLFSEWMLKQKCYMLSRCLLREFVSKNSLLCLSVFKFFSHDDYMPITISFRAGLLFGLPFENEATKDQYVPQWCLNTSRLNFEPAQKMFDHRFQVKTLKKLFVTESLD